FAERILDLHTEGTSGPSAEEAPYLGLSTFSSQQSERFFGREKEAEAFANRLRMQALLAVVGPSGAGKSSFIQAGVLPVLKGWRAVTVRPGPSPFSALAALLEAEHVLPPGVNAAQAKDRLLSNPTELGKWLEAAAIREGQTFVLVIDQFEELVTLCADPE